MSSSLLDGLLDPKYFVPELKGSTASEAIWEIVQLMQESGELREAKAFFEAVMEREKKSPTVADDGVAYPHARTELVDEIMLGIGRSRKGVRFDGSEDLVHLIFVIAVPQQMVNDYLICVGRTWPGRFGPREREKRCWKQQLRLNSSLDCESGIDSLGAKSSITTAAMLRCVSVRRGSDSATRAIQPAKSQHGEPHRIVYSDLLRSRARARSSARRSLAVKLPMPDFEIFSSSGSIDS